MRRPRRGFTLVELMIVVTIIGILIAFILKAAIGSLRRAEHSATVSLIAKLESALTDRVDALTTSRAEPNLTHQNLAGIWTGATVLPSNQRAQVIAQFDMLRAELPDVFVVTTSTTYPLNFAAAPFPPGSTADANFALPLGQAVPIAAGGCWDPTTSPTPVGVTGMYGASFSAAGALYKQLGYGPKGTDGADNDQDGLIDEKDEGTSGLSADDVATIDNHLLAHKHKTAGPRMLYAILVEGTGPLGSVFNKDDFNDNEVRDTDGDGMLEFVDAWGEPLQFFRWPIMYRSDTQKGFPDLAKIAQDTALGAPIGPYLPSPRPLRTSTSRASRTPWTRTRRSRRRAGS
jgi:prepilin-type N-terminal cleavage/methylation domain-containing protein